MKKYKYNINNLDCANCAREIEEFLDKNKNFNNVRVNFNTLTLSYESDKNFSLDEINDLIQNVEPDVSVSEEVMDNKKEFNIIILLLGVLISIFAYFLKVSNTTKLILYLISYVLLLYRTTLNAVKLLFKSKTINENALLTISCIGAFIIGDVMEGVMVITLYTIGKILEEKAVNNSRKSIKNLMNLKSPYANIKRGNNVIQDDVSKVLVNDILIVKKGEAVPVDGVVIKGVTRLDTSSLTGESDALVVKKGDSVLSSSINLENVIEIRATKEFSESTASKVLELLESATEKKSKTETVVSKVSKIYTPVVLFLAFMVSVILPTIFNVSVNDALYRSLTFLVISCPCAIAISVPLSYFTAIGVASRKGIFIKGSNYLDNLSNVKNIIFDKTGTLTNGSFVVTDIKVLDKNYTVEEVIDILVKGESFSNHPIAKSIMKLKNSKVNNKDVKDYEEIEGRGIRFKLNNKNISIGNKNICKCKYEATLHLNIDNKHIASIYINDGIKENVANMISNLKSSGIKTYMFTGDKKETAIDIGKKIGIDEIKYEMLPTDKYENYEKIANKNEITIFVGDGVNDAPTLKRADIGISMGNVGTDASIEASDVVLMNDDVDKIPLAIDISKYTKYIIKQNLVFAIVVKLAILLLSVFGYANMWLAVFADTGVTLLTILNTLRIIKRFK